VIFARNAQKITPQSKDLYYARQRLRRRKAFFHDELGGYPPPPDLWNRHFGEKLEVIYGAQSVAGKILSRKELASGG